jgi:signal transduction histidine kinase
MLAFLLYNTLLTSKRAIGISVFISLLFLINTQTRNFRMADFVVAPLFLISASFYAFICESKKITCLLLHYLYNEIIRYCLFSRHDQTLFHNCTLAQTTYLIAAVSFVHVLFISFFGQHAFWNMSTAESLLEIQKNLVRSISHEIRTPLGNVQMSIENVRTCQFYNSL